MTDQPDRLYYMATEKGHRIDRLQKKIHERLVSDCTIVDFIAAMEAMSPQKARYLMWCFHYSLTSEFYQLITSALYDYFLQTASDDAMRIGEIEY